jgi:hypothetical protein
VSEKHLQIDPHNIRGRKDAWWYEEPQGICVVVEPVRDEWGRYVAQTVKIPWRSIESALKRKSK